MDFQDKSIVCSDCGVAFTFSIVEQEYFQSRDYANDPKRCLPCRKVRQTQRTGSVSYKPDRPMFSATCAECGIETKIPFEPFNAELFTVENAIVKSKQSL
jgi:hypothetical protein